MEQLQKLRVDLVVEALKTAVKHERQRAYRIGMTLDVLRGEWERAVEGNGELTGRIEEQLQIAWSSYKDAHDRHQEALRQLETHVERDRQKRHG